MPTEDANAESVEFSAIRQVARVRSVVDDGHTVYLELRNGQFAHGTSTDEIKLSAGTIVLVGENTLDPVPDEVWPEEPWVGTVRLKNEKHTVIDASGHLHRIPTRMQATYDVGNTVLARDSGVIEKLSDEPIRVLELPSIDDTFIAQFVSQPGPDAETFADFGGDADIRRRALELIEVPLKYHDELVEIGARAIRGVLFTGPPGTGKTMLARIIAAHAKATFYKISGPEVVSKWLGQSEEILRKIFEHAAEHKPAIVFFDEIDSVAIKRDQESHEASRRLVATLLTLLDGFEPKDRIVVIATTNLRENIDAALLRPGRFDWEIEFALPTRDERESILRTSARKLRVREPLPHSKVADETELWSGADLTAIWSEAAILAVTDNGRREIIDEDYLGGFQRVTQQRERARRSVAK